MAFSFIFVITHKWMIVKFMRQLQSGRERIYYIFKNLLLKPFVTLNLFERFSKLFRQSNF